MQNTSQKIVTIRNRNQVTIPQSFSKSTSWLQPHSVVVISKKNNEVTLKPYQTSKKTLSNKEWDELWKKLKEVRSYKGKYKGSLSDFVIKDRENH